MWCKWTFSIGSRGGGVPVAHGGAALRVRQIGWVSHLSAYGPEQKAWYGPPLRSPPLSMYNGWRGNSHVFKGKRNKDDKVNGEVQVIYVLMNLKDLIFGCKWTFSIGSRGGGVPVAHGGSALRVRQIGWVSHLSAYGPEQKSWYGPPLRSPPPLNVQRVEGQLSRI